MHECSSFNGWDASMGGRRKSHLSDGNGFVNYCLRGLISVSTTICRNDRLFGSGEKGAAWWSSAAFRQFYLLSGCNQHARLL